jgi:RHS repeat-associated protein
VKNLAILAQIDTQKLELSDTLRIFEEFVGVKNYELSNHLGNVLATISDKTIFNTDHYNGIVYSAQLYYPFGWEIPTLSYTAKSYRYGFNGVEKAREIGEGVNTTFYREQDTRAGRWWSFDPRPNAAVSPYAMMENNPIAFSDVLGDTTRVYSAEDGMYKETINDNLPNQEIFMTKIKYDILNKANLNDNDKANVARRYTEYYIGENTRQKIKNVMLESNAEGKERFYILGVKGLPLTTFKTTIYLSSGGELDVIDVTSNIERTSNIIDGAQGQIAIDNYRSNNPDFFIIGWGHTHIKASAYTTSTTNSTFDMSKYVLPRLNRPTSPSPSPQEAGVGVWPVADYSPLLRNPYSKLEGGSPAIIATPHAYTIYSTMTRDNSQRGYKEVNNPPNPNMFFEKHRVYNYLNGNLIYDAYQEFGK